MRRILTLAMFVAAVAVIGAFWLVGPLAAAGPAQERSANLIVNGSFEQATASRGPARWNASPQVYSLDPTVARTGKGSLKYHNGDAQRYLLCIQSKVPVRPGWKYRFSVWVKTENLSGGDSGATICLEWGKNGKHMGGSYPGGIKGTRGWTRVEAIARVPADATSCHVACYARPGMTGTAWFDDVEIVRIADPPMQSVLLSPVYRGQVTSAGPGEARVRVRWNLADNGLKPQQLRIVAALVGADKKPLGEVSVRPEQEQLRYLDVGVPLKDLKPGPYDLVVRLEGPAGKELQTASHPLVRLPDGPPPKSFIDEHCRLIVAGKPFFPIGMYWSGINAADIAVYSQSKFNCLMPYGSPSREQMDLAHRHGLKVIYSVKDWYAGLTWCPKFIRSESEEQAQIRKRVREFRDHPALLAWYLNDELPQKYMRQLELHQQWVSQEDPGHPTWVVLYQFSEVGAYLRTFDVIGTDPYPISHSPASMAARWTAETFRQVEGARPLWQVPQLHNWTNYAKSKAEKKQRTPTCDEVRSMAWQCICEGAKGLVFFSWFDVKRNPDVPFAVQWDGLKRIAAEIDQMAPILLSIEPVPAVGIEGKQPDWLHALSRVHAGKLYLIAVNDGDGEGRVVYRLPAVPRKVRLLGHDRLIQAQGKTLPIELPRLAVQCYEVDLTP